MGIRTSIGKIKYDRLTQNLFNELSSYQKGYDSQGCAFYYAPNGVVRIMVQHDEMEITISAHVDKFFLDQETRIDVVRKFFNCQNYKIIWN